MENKRNNCKKEQINRKAAKANKENIENKENEGVLKNKEGKKIEKENMAIMNKDPRVVLLKQKLTKGGDLVKSFGELYNIFNEYREKIKKENRNTVDIKKIEPNDEKRGFDVNNIESSNVKKSKSFELVKFFQDGTNSYENFDYSLDDDEDSDSALFDNSEIPLYVCPISTDKIYVHHYLTSAIYDLNGTLLKYKKRKFGGHYASTHDNNVIVYTDESPQDIDFVNYDQNLKFKSTLRSIFKFGILISSKNDVIVSSDKYVYFWYKADGEIGLSILWTDFTKLRCITSDESIESIDGSTYKLRKDYQTIPSLYPRNDKIYIWYITDHQIDIVDEKTFTLIKTVNVPKVKPSTSKNGDEFEIKNKIFVDCDGLIILKNKNLLMFLKEQENCNELLLLKSCNMYNFNDFCVTNNGKLVIMDDDRKIYVY